MTTVGIVILLLVIVVFMFFMMTKKGGGCCGGGSDPGVGGGSCCALEDQGEPHGHHEEPEGRAAIDPVCGMKADPEGDLSLAHNGRRYGFCSEQCRQNFAADPGKYV